MKKKVGASKVFFTKVKEELQFIPAQLKVLEYWQEKGRVRARRSGTHPCRPAPGSPAGQVQRHHLTAGVHHYLQIRRWAATVSLGKKCSSAWDMRSAVPTWPIGSSGWKTCSNPLIHLMREVQNSSDYLQADETRIQVLKEDGKTAQSDKWMWVTRGGPPDQPSVLFDYDPSRAGSVPVRLLDDFQGILQADGYSGYGQVCRANAITRIGCWDHARRKFVEASKAAQGKGKAKKGIVAKADVALSHINKLYAIERQIKELSDAERHRIRQAKSLPQLDALKTWLEANVHKVLKGSLTRKAMEYTLNQWTWLVGYCDRGDLQISNILAENAIRPFAIGRNYPWFSIMEGCLRQIPPSRYFSAL
ncbi:MAG: IS66 family transposase [Marinobacter sp.]|nr:IS66 family transposase [Marinobacter sp.]